MPEKEPGLYYSSAEDSYRSLEEIKQSAINKTYPDKKVRSLDYDRVTRYIEEGQGIMQDFELGQREATFVPQVEYPELPIVMLLASDIHYGSMGVNYPLLKRHLDIVGDTPNFYLATNGDEVDAFNAVFHPTGMTENPLPPQVQSRAIAGKLLELDSLGKVAVLSQGNHNRSGFAGGQDWYDSFLSEFNCPVFTQGGLLRVRHGTQEYKILMNHTYWGKSKLNPTNSPKRMLEYEGVYGGEETPDIAWVGHVHQGAVEHFSRNGKDVIGVVSGTYKEVDKWASQNGIGGRGQRGGICVVLWGDRKKMEAFRDIESALEFMVGRYR